MKYSIEINKDKFKEILVFRNKKYSRTWSYKYKDTLQSTSPSFFKQLLADGIDNPLIVDEIHERLDESSFLTDLIDLSLRE